jgi:hypothetical protein
MFSNSLRTFATLAILSTVAFSVPIEDATAGSSTFRGYHVDLSKLAGAPNASAIADGIQRQLDIIEGVGLQPRVLEFLHTVPIIADAAVNDALRIRTADAYPLSAATRAPRHLAVPPRPSRAAQAAA